jgi:hypothetical protein
MRSRLFAYLLVALLALSMLPPTQAMASASGEAGQDTDAWWLDWPGDGDRNGVHDHLERLAEEALMDDPDARVDLVVDLDRVPRAKDLDRLERLGMTVDHVSHHVDAVLGSAPAASIEAIGSLPGVVMLEAQGKGVPLLASAGPSVGIPRVHEDLGFDGTGVTVAVLDTGISASHSSLDDLDDDPSTDDPKLVAFYDAYVNSTSAPYDSGQHGTWVAGIAVGTGQPGGNNVGGAPGSKLVGVRIGSPGGFPEHTALRGIDWVIDNKDAYNISVMVCSWGIVLGGPNDHNGNSAVSRAADEAVAAGISVVVAAGNSALSATVTAPGDARNVITVGSVDDNHRLSSFSSEGPTTDGRTKPDVCAPGEDINGPNSNNDNGWYGSDGTSAAAPLVGGIIATMVQANPDITPSQVKQILHETSEHNTARTPKYIRTPNNGYGWGVVHAPGAVSRAKDLRSPSLDIPVQLESGEALDLEAVGSYTRTEHTELGENGMNRLGEDEVVMEVTIPDEWGRPPPPTYEMDGDIIATIIPGGVTQESGSWRIRATFRMLNDVGSLTTAHPTIRFSTTAPVTSQAETYTLTTQEILNSMVGLQGRIRVSVGGNVPPEIELVSPNGGPETTDTFFVIRWTDDDPDDDARISLYNDQDTNPDNGRVMIVTNLREDLEGDGDSYVWDTSTLVEGQSFYVQAVISDGKNPEVSVYSEGTVTIRHTGGNAPPTVDVLEPDGSGDTADLTYTIQYVARDPDDTASVSIYWDDDDGGYDGSAIVRDLDESDGPASYVWDTSGQPDGARLYIYVVVSDGQNPQARDYGNGPVTIEHQAGPRVEDHSPTGTDVSVDVPVRVTFDRDMNHAITQAATTIDPGVPGSFSWTGYTMRFEPAGGWSPNTYYTVTVSTHAQDAEGHRLDTTHQWSFTTGDPPIPPEPPVVTIVAPVEDETVAGLYWIEGTSENLGSGGVVEVRIDGEDWEEASGNEHWSLAWDTEQTFDGGHTVSARGRDKTGRTSGVFTVNVTVANSPNSPPEVEPVDDIKVTSGNRATVQVVATDPDGDDLIYSDDTDLFDINPSSGLISFTPTKDQVKVWRVTVTVWDGAVQSKVTFLVTVEEADDTSSILDMLPLTPFQLMILIAAIVVVAGAILYRRRSHDRGAGVG